MMPHEHEELQELVNEFVQMTRTIATDPRINSYDLRTVLRFLTKVVNVVSQAFQDVLSLLIEVKYLQPDDFQSRKIIDLQKELELLRARSRYRDAEEICSRLKHLSAHYDQEIAPIVSNLGNSGQWWQFYRLLQEHEGGIIDLVNQTTWTLERMFSGMYDPAHIKDISLFAGRKADSIRRSLSDLQLLNNQILGLSGRSGFLELTEDRSALSQQANVIISQRSTKMGDSYNVSGQAGAVGPNAHAHDMTFTQMGSQIEKAIDLQQLAQDLSKLRQAMKQEAQEAEQDGAVGDVSKAEQAAKAGDSTKVAEYLKSAGKWALDIATKIGATLATEALKTALGMK